MGRLLVEFVAGTRDSADLSFDELSGEEAALARTADLLDEVESSVREDYVRWIGDRSVEAMNGSGPGGAPTRSGTPIWWLSSASMRDNEADPTFERLCRIAVIELALERESPEELVAMAPDAAISAVLARLCGERGVEYRPIGERGDGEMPRLGRALAGRVRVAARIVAARLLAQVLPSPRGGQGAVTFLSAWPETLRFDPEPRDSSFRGLLDEARTRIGATVATILVPALRPRRRVANLVRGTRGAPVAALPRFARLADLATVARSTALAIACVREARRIERSGGRPFRGFDAREVLDLPLLATLSRAEVAQNLAIEAQAERWARSTRPSAVVSALELYPVARAVYVGARAGHPAIRVIALQHALVTPAKLWYALDPREREGSGGIPAPDVVMCQGESARAVLGPGGFAADEMPLTGSPRYDGLRPADRDDTPGEGRVLVLPSLDGRDGELLVEAAVAAALAAGARDVVVQPHPLQPGPADVAERMNPSGLRVSVSREPLYEALAKADVAVASYSTTADEALVRGVPVIAYGGLRPFMGSASWTGAIPFARTRGALAEHLGRALSHEVAADEEEIRRHIQWVFHTLDGRATERCLEVIREAAPQRADDLRA